MAAIWQNWTQATTAATTSVSTWQNWVTTGSPTPSFGSTTVIWTYWTNGTSSAATNELTTIWQDWQTFGSGSAYPTYPRQVESDEQREARLAREAEYRATQLERAARRQEAEERAKALLAEMLTDEQEAELERDGHFHVQVRDPRDRRFRTFRLHTRSRSGNVAEIKDGEVISRYCIHLYGEEPLLDSIVAQKLMLETDLENFERVANITRLGSPPVEEAEAVPA